MIKLPFFKKEQVREAPLVEVPSYDQIRDPDVIDLLAEVGAHVMKLLMRSSETKNVYFTVEEITSCGIYEVRIDWTSTSSGRVCRFCRQWDQLQLAMRSQAYRDKKCSLTPVEQLKDEFVDHLNAALQDHPEWTQGSF